MLFFETSPKRQSVKPTPLTFAEDQRALKLINRLISLDELWLSDENALLQQFVDNYQYLRNKNLKKIYFQTCEPRTRKNVKQRNQFS